MAGAAFQAKILESRPFSRLCWALCRQNIVAAGLADRCEIQISYAIGVAEPTSIHVETFGTGNIDDHAMHNSSKNIFTHTTRYYQLTEFATTHLPSHRQLWTFWT